MATSVGVKASKQAVSRNGLPKPVKAGLGSFLSAKKHAGMHASGVIHGHDQVPHRFRHPAVGTGILMEHHPRQWGPLTLDAVLADLLGSWMPPGGIASAILS